MGHPVIHCTLLKLYFIFKICNIISCVLIHSTDGCYCPVLRCRHILSILLLNDTSVLRAILYSLNYLLLQVSAGLCKFTNMKFLSRKLSHPVRHEQKIVNFLTGSDFYVQFLFIFFQQNPTLLEHRASVCACVYMCVWSEKKLDVDRRICACIS